MTNELKLITSLCPCVIISFFPIILSMKRIVLTEKNSYKEIIRDVPAKADFDDYLKALENTIDFSLKHKIYVDLNLEFGMFLVEVNLKSYMQEKRYTIPPKTRFRLEQILLKIEILGDYFHYMVLKHNDGKNKKYSQDMEITQLFYNTTTWPRPPDKFNMDLLNRTRIYNPKQLKEIYGNWKVYYNNVNDFAKSKPSPKESDGCIELLARTSLARFPAHCRIPRHCEKTLQEGSEYGYGLSHRLLFMVIARFSRKCTVVTEKVDKDKADKYCRRAFYEAQFIALNNFKLPDLMYEHIALCGLFGHAQFFQNTWLRRLLQFQTSEGCFSDKIATGEFDSSQMKEGENDEWKIANPEDIMNGQCNGHFTAVAAATLSSALRYIIETYD